MKEIVRVSNLSIGKKIYKNKDKIIQINDHNYLIDSYLGDKRLKKYIHNSKQIIQIAIKNKKFGVF